MLNQKDFNQKEHITLQTYQDEDRNHAKCMSSTKGFRCVFKKKAQKGEGVVSKKMTGYNEAFGVHTIYC